MVFITRLVKSYCFHKVEIFFQLSTCFGIKKTMWNQNFSKASLSIVHANAECHKFLNPISNFGLEYLLYLFMSLLSLAGYSKKNLK